MNRRRLLLPILVAFLLAGAWWGSTGFRRKDKGDISPSDEEITGSFILPDCPADTSGLRFGALCKGVSDGKIKIRDTSGVRDLGDAS